MIQSVAFIKPQRNSYGVVSQFTKQLHRAFQNLGLESALIDSDQGVGVMVEQLKACDAQLSIGFNGPVPASDGRCLPDFTGIPHLVYLLDPPYIFLDLKEHPLMHLACVDRSHCELFDALGCDRHLFLPHAADRSFIEQGAEEKRYDLTLLATSVDPDALRLRWKESYGEQVAKLLERLGDEVLSSPRNSTLRTMEQVLQRPLAELFQTPVAGIHPLVLWRTVELYVRAVDRVDLVRGLDQFSVHVFGDAFSMDSRGWKELLADCPHATAHPAVDYGKSLDIMRQSRITLNSSPFFKHGGHERIFTALACGAAVLSSDNSFLRQSFSPAEAVLSYRPGKVKSLERRIRSLLDDDERYARSITAGREKVSLWHCWEKRAEAILDYALNRTQR